MWFCVCVFVGTHHPFILFLCGMWVNDIKKVRRQVKTLSSWVAGIKKGFQRMKEQPSQLHLPEDVPAFVRRVQGPATVVDEWEHRSLSGGRQCMNTEHWPESQRERRKDETTERRESEREESKWEASDNAEGLHSERKGNGRDEESQVSRYGALLRETIGRKAWHEGQSGWTGRNTKQMDREEELEAEQGDD